MGNFTRARVAELVDALVSGTSVSNDVEVQVLSRAPKQYADLYGRLVVLWPEDLNLGRECPVCI